MRRFAGSWPHLRSLDLPLEIKDSTIWPSLSTLYNFVDFCPKLKYLRIPLDISHIPLLSYRRLSAHPLKHLSIGSANAALGMQDILLVARHLDRLFPSLKVLNHSGRNAEMWESIFAVLQAFQAVRLDDLDRHHNSMVQ